MCCCFVVLLILFLLLFPHQLSDTHICLNSFEAEGAVETETDVSASVSWMRMMVSLLIQRLSPNTTLPRQKNYHEGEQRHSGLGAGHV